MKEHDAPRQLRPPLNLTHDHLGDKKAENTGREPELGAVAFAGSEQHSYEREKRHSEDRRRADVDVQRLSSVTEAADVFAARVWSRCGHQGSRHDKDERARD